MAESCITLLLRHGAERASGMKQNPNRAVA